MDNKSRVAAVYSQDNARKTAEQAMAVAARNGAKLQVVGIFPECGGAYAELTERLYRYSAGIGAEMTVLYSREPALALLDYVGNNHIKELVISESDSSGAAKLIGDILPDVSVTPVAAERGSVFHLFAADLFCCALRQA